MAKENKIKLKLTIKEIMWGTFPYIFLNESTQVGLKTVEKIQTRLAQNIEGFNNFLICNPRSPNHWLYRKVEQNG